MHRLNAFKSFPVKNRFHAKSFQKVTYLNKKLESMSNHTFCFSSSLILQSYALKSFSKSLLFFKNYFIQEKIYLVTFLARFWVSVTYWFAYNFAYPLNWSFMNTAAISNALIQWKSTQFHRSTKLLAQNLESTYRETYLKRKIQAYK